jgi:GTP-binding protein Era
MTSKSYRCGYVPILGRPNVGKSTLTNSLLKFKLSVVTRKPQTTRHRALGILNGPDYQMILLDTPGFLEPSYRLQELMVRTAMATLAEGDAVLLMTEPEADTFAELSRLLEGLEASGKPVVLAINKIDLVGKPALLPLIEHFTKLFPFKEIVPISALEGDGTDHLQEVLAGYLPEGPPLYPPDEITDRPERFFVAEMIREKVFRLYGAEIPYSTAVIIEEFKDRKPPAKNYIRAAVIVERASQKGVLIGKGGVALKRLGRLVREEVEAFLEREVYLELQILVRDKWRKRDSVLKDLGYR